LTDRPTKITFGEMRRMGVRGVLVYCADFRCSRSIRPLSQRSLQALDQGQEPKTPSDGSERYVLVIARPHRAMRRS
jgi:hypothetical protein